MVYHLLISDEQRLALLELVKDAAPLEAPDEEHPLAYWERMLTDLPIQEAGAPGVLHGFCL